jgi:hypothetical protein
MYREPPLGLRFAICQVTPSSKERYGYAEGPDPTNSIRWGRVAMQMSSAAATPGGWVGIRFQLAPLSVLAYTPPPLVVR